MALFAQLGGYSVLQLLLIVIVIAAAVAITVVVLRQMGMAIPPFIITILWILVAAFVGVVALVFLFRMIGNVG
jgi:hypothetical protein